MVSPLFKAIFEILYHKLFAHVYSHRKTDNNENTLDGKHSFI